jgi:endonuclease I
MSRIRSFRVLAALGLLFPALASADVFLNEFHYDDADSPTTGDTNESIEVVATAGEDLSLYDIVLYNGAATYDTDPLPVGSLVACGATVRFATITYPLNGLQNGPNDGIALVLRSNSSVVQFLSYEGAITATNGPASGMTSTNLPVSETNGTVEGTSLQLGGNATNYAGFTWNASATATLGTCNNGQTFGAAPDVAPTVQSSVPAHNAVDVSVDAALTVTFSEPVNADSDSFALNCGMGTPSITPSAAPANTYTLTPSAPLGYSRLCTLTVVGSEVLDTDGTPTAMESNATIQFETEADNLPEVLSVTPVDQATGVGRAANLSVTFSEPVTAPATAFGIFCPDTAMSSLAFQLASADATTFTLDPNADLPPATLCRLYVDNLQVTDQDGTPDNPDRDSSTTFTTAALAPPAVVSTVPIKNATNFPPAGDLQVLFDTSVTLAPGAFSLVCAQSAGIVLSHASSGSSFVIGTGTVLVEGDNCTFTIESTAVTSGDALNLDSDEVVNFTVASSSAATYWQNVNLSSPAQLRCSIHETIRNHTALTYTQAWEVLEAGEEDPANAARVLDAYRNCSYLAGPTGDRVGGSGGGATCSGDPNELYNREHTWPNSLGFPINTLAPYTDTHMLYATDEGYNASRGNKPYADCPVGCTEEPTSVNNGVGGGTGVYPGNSNWYDGSSYEVWNHRKGDMARAVMYMAIRYEGEDNAPDLELTDTRALIVAHANTDPVAYMGLLSTLLSWNTFDAPDQRELDRNAIVQTYQGNRNPFIDHPEWATAGLFGSVQPPTCVLNTNAPAANNDSYNATQGNLLSVNAASGVLANDSDVEGAPLSAQLVSNVTSGTLALAANGSFTYTPAAAVCGNATFTYRASDGVRVSATRTATIAVSGCAANQPPVANDATFGLAENTAAPTVVGTVVANDPDSVNLSYQITAGNGAGAFAMDGNQLRVANAALLDFEATPVWTLTVTVSDDAAPAASDTATITVNLSNVEEGPAVANNDNATVGEDSSNNTIAVLANDVADPDGGALVLSAVGTASNGSLSFDAGSVRYTPAANYCGADSFTYTVNGVASATVSVSVTCANDAPAIAAPLAARSGSEGVTIAPFSVAGGFTDVEGDDLDYVLTGLPAGLTFDAETGLVSGTPTAGSSNASPYTVTVTASDGSLQVQQTFQFTVGVLPLRVFQSGFEGS